MNQPLPTPPTTPSAPLKPTTEQLTAAQKYQQRMVESIHKAIVLEPALHANRLPEAIFRDYFLPAFTGKVELGNHYEEWISIAGAPGKEVAILAPNGIDVLFNVPALMNTDHIKRDRPEGSLPFASIVMMAEAFRTRSGVHGDAVLTKQGMDRYKASHDSKHDNSEAHKRWLDIFVRYGYATLEQTQEETKKAASDAIDDDDFVEK